MGAWTRTWCVALVIIGACGPPPPPIETHTDVSVVVSPASASVEPGASLQFTATVTGTSNREVTWSSMGGSIDGEGLFTAPFVDGPVRVTATSRADTRASAQALVTVVSEPLPAVSVSISPSTASVEVGGSLSFSATVRGAADGAVVWSTDHGSVDASGHYTAPGSALTAHVTATSRADGKTSATATVTVSASPAVSVAIDPRTATVSPGATLQFNASVTGSADTTVLWTADSGSIDATGLFQAPSGGTAHVRATSRADPTKWASATVTVASTGGEVSISPTRVSAVSMNPAPIRFSASVSGASDGVTWSIQEGAAGGTIDQDGAYLPPQHQSISRQAHVVATSRQDPSKSAVAVVDIWGDLVDHGGAVASTLRSFVVWWGPSSDFQADERSALEGFLRGLNGSDYLGIADQYMRGKTASVLLGGSFEEPTPPPPGRPPMDDVLRVACGTVQGHGFTPGPSDVVILASSRETDDFSCGWHTWMTCGDNNVLLIYLASRREFCSDDVTVCPGSGHSREATSLVVTASHELFETITDPWSDAWFANGEISDKCGAQACVQLSTGTFGVPQLYSNEVHGCAPR